MRGEISSLLVCVVADFSEFVAAAAYETPVTGVRDDTICRASGYEIFLILRAVISSPILSLGMIENHVFQQQKQASRYEYTHYFTPLSLLSTILGNHLCTSRRLQTDQSAASSVELHFHIHHQTC
ncbi:hypothetical protein TNIN_243671 [Trichonephila inaurata madagascariensis]|uniref:Secreted protein n=1 Tax=Trichonephila inaurata madagascariensis TaxID=2747483 RepID=A0A8X6Y9G7_9ARAC|nr:hypothetical protein TNIN_243671 [Trichonephila inaurata madagascariensis]